MVSWLLCLGRLVSKADSHAPLHLFLSTCSSVSPHLLELYWSTLCASLCSFIIVYYHIYMSFNVLLVHMCTCVHMFFIDGISLLFICYLLFILQFCIILCTFLWSTYVSHMCRYVGYMCLLQSTSFWLKILNLQDTGILAFHLFVCLCVLCVMWFFGFIPFIFFHLLCMTLFPPIFPAVCPFSVVWPRVLCKLLGGW